MEQHCSLEISLPLHMSLRYSAPPYHAGQLRDPPGTITEHSVPLSKQISGEYPELARSGTLWWHTQTYDSPACARLWARWWHCYGQLCWAVLSSLCILLEEQPYGDAFRILHTCTLSCH